MSELEDTAAERDRLQVALDRAQRIAFGPGVWEERMTTEHPAVDEAIFRRRASLPANFLLEMEDMRRQRAIIECPEGQA